LRGSERCSFCSRQAGRIYDRVTRAEDLSPSL
jgi:hypothetical protein